jgi:tetraacyldisaccharide 4'-kinase
VSISADSFLQRLWYDGSARWLSLALLPLSWLFRAVSSLRAAAYRAGVLPSVRLPRPVIIVGNITVGGTGKTPLTIWIATQLHARGLRVGIILRGYGGQSAQWPRDVVPETPWQEVGDEAVLLASRTGAIVVAGPDRVAAARRAIERGAQVIISDDGLQHYRLKRDCEIAVVDAERGLGNRRWLPAGPLREGPERLASVALTIITQRSPATTSPASDGVTAVTRLLDAVSLTTGERQALHAFRGMQVHAIAGIGHPQSFFDALAGLDIKVQRHPLPDHARLTAADISFADQRPVLMTEKDAVKCRAIADQRHWAVRMDIELSERDAARLSATIDRCIAPAAPVCSKIS